MPSGVPTVSELRLELVLAPRALRDLQAISDYLKLRSPTGARRVLASLKASLVALQSSPGLGVRVSEAGHRRLPVVTYPYAI